MIDVSTLPLLKGKKALVTGIANDQSIAWGCAKAFRAFGADLAITYLNDKAKPYVEPLAKEVEASIFCRSMSRSTVSWKRCSTPSRSNGATSILSSIQSLSRPKLICKVGWSTARGRAFFSPWTCPAGRSSAWQSSPNR